MNFKRFAIILDSLAFLCLQCMASTTLNEYRMQFEKDKALARRFQPVLINEPSQVVINMIVSFCIFM